MHPKTNEFSYLLFTNQTITGSLRMTIRSTESSVGLFEFSMSFNDVFEDTWIGDGSHGVRCLISILG